MYIILVKVLFYVLVSCQTYVKVFADFFFESNKYVPYSDVNFLSIN